MICPSTSVTDPIAQRATISSAESPPPWKRCHSTRTAELDGPTLCSKPAREWRLRRRARITAGRYPKSPWWRGKLPNSDASNSVPVTGNQPQLIQASMINQRLPYHQRLAARRRSISAKFGGIAASAMANTRPMHSGTSEKNCGILSRVTPFRWR